jgi:hypothetical protein
MRRLLALIFGSAYLAYSVMAGAAHVHDAADHHDQMQGLHLDHAHVDDAWTDPTGHHHHHPAPPDEGQPRFETGHVDHHEGDVLYLTMTAQRSLGSGLRILPAMTAVAVAVEPPSRVCTSRIEVSEHLRGPPRKRLTPSRAPPV